MKVALVALLMLIACAQSPSREVSGETTQESVKYAGYEISQRQNVECTRYGKTIDCGSVKCVASSGHNHQQLDCTGAYEQIFVLRSANEYSPTGMVNCKRADQHAIVCYGPRGQDSCEFGSGKSISCEKGPECSATYSNSLKCNGLPTPAALMKYADYYIF